MWWDFIIIFGLSFIQNVSFSIVSRSRNRDNKKYLIIASFFSNGIWYLTFRALVLRDMTMLLFVPYTLGNVLGSVIGVTVSMWFEKLLGAQSDSHIKKKESYTGTVYAGIKAIEIKDGIIINVRSVNT